MHCAIKKYDSFFSTINIYTGDNSINLDIARKSEGLLICEDYIYRGKKLFKESQFYLDILEGKECELSFLNIGRYCSMHHKSNALWIEGFSPEGGFSFKISLAKNREDIVEFIDELCNSLDELLIVDV